MAKFVLKEIKLDKNLLKEITDLTQMTMRYQPLNLIRIINLSSGNILTKNSEEEKWKVIKAGQIFYVGPFYTNQNQPLWNIISLNEKNIKFSIYGESSPFQDNVFYVQDDGIYLEDKKIYFTEN